LSSTQLFVNININVYEWTTPEFRNTPSTTNLEEEEIVDAPGNDGKASMLEQVKRPNPWRKMMVMMMINVYNSVSININL
jgi:hypothetical protein